MAKTDGPLRCAIYARMSTDKQSEASPADQVARCREFSARQGWRVVDDLVVKEAGISGASRHNRPGLLRLMDRISEWDVLLCWDFSRLARDSEDLGWIRNHLRVSKKTAHEVTTGLDIFNVGSKVMGIINEEYLVKLRADTQRGLLGRAERGLATGGLAYGYRSEPVIGGSSRIVIDEERAPIVRAIFARYAAGAGLGELARTLNFDRLPPPRPRALRDRPASWAPSAIREILRNTLYRGVRIYNRTEWIKDHATGRRRRFERPEGEWRREERPDLAIVSPELFETVQREIERRSLAGPYQRASDGHSYAGTLAGRGHRVATRHVLSGFLECGACGGAFYAAKSTGRYGCAWHRKRGSAVCESTLTVTRLALEERIFGAIRERILLPEIVTYAAMRAAEEVADRLDDLAPVDVDEGVSEIETEISTLRRVAARSSRPSEVARIIAELERERASLSKPPGAFGPIDQDVLRAVVTARVIEMRQAFEGSDEERRAAFRVLLADRRMRISADPEQRFRVEGVFELPLDEGDSRSWSVNRESPIQGSGGALRPRRAGHPARVRTAPVGCMIRRQAA
ncbi:MAG TPA: recombinase family protein [Myxococcota bacterium]|nr:recombinase family protein [Myxococcota bacterium]